MLMVPSALSQLIILSTRTKRNSLNFKRLLKPETLISVELQRLSTTLKQTCAVLEMNKLVSSKSSVNLPVNSTLSSLKKPTLLEDQRLS